MLASTAGLLLLLGAAAPPDDLRCEYLVNPLGIDAARPRLSWKLRPAEAGARGLKQSAYRVLVAADEATLAADKSDLWDSGKVESDRSIHVEYAGKPLESHAYCWWKVRVWDQDGKASEWSKPAHWTMGLLHPADWKAPWIGLDGGEGEGDDEPSAVKKAQWVWFPEGNPAVGAPIATRYFRRTFDLPKDGKIVKAVCAITADDEFVLYINGKKAGAGKDWRAAVEIDVTARLHAGANTLAVAATNAADPNVGPDHNPAGLIAALRIEMDKGDPVQVSTDERWRTSDKQADGWEAEDFDDSRWEAAKKLGAYGMAPWGEFGATEHRRLPARMLRREFTIEKKVKRAVAYVCGLGFFDLHLNGKPVGGDQFMNPALTGYDRRALYCTFDVTADVKRGANALGVVLGNGRYFAPRRKQPVDTTTYGYPKLLFQLRLEYDDGSTEDVVGDEKWNLTADGPIRANNEYDGEDYDARKEQPGWAAAGFDDAAWKPARLVKAPGGALEAQMVEPIRVTETLKPVAVKEPKPGVFVVDFGQAFYGVVRLHVSGPAGTRVQMHTSFNVTADGLLNDANDRSALNRDVYILRGKGDEVWNPRFKGNATRYVQVEGFPGKPSAENFEGLVLHTDMEAVGRFACSNDLINKIYSNARWGTRMQNRSVPMEPDRDERMPWSGHPAKTSESEGYAFNVARFYDHFLHNYRVHQGDDGSLQEILPPYWTFNNKDVIWPSVATIIPDWHHSFYGDERILADNYECMTKFVRFCEKTYQKPDFTVDYCHYGDWVDSSWIKDTTDKRTTSRPLMSTAYHYNNCRIVARAARLLGKDDDAKYFADLADKVQAGFNKRFFDPKTDKYESETQGSYVFALAFGLVPEDHKDAVVANLVDEILVKHKGHTSVGLVGMQWFMQVLTDAGRPDVAYRVATQTTRPSWGYMISKGATTSWERWDADVQDGGMNGESQKILSGNFEAWLYQTLGGINYDPDKPGFKHIILHPRPVGDLKWAKCTHRSMYGEVVSDWKIEDGVFRWSATIPPNTTATVYVPAKAAKAVREGDKLAGDAESVKFLRLEGGAAVYEVGSGNYTFTSTDWAPAGK
jgi:alpha-L-rhamnosidase